MDAMTLEQIFRCVLYSRKMLRVDKKTNITDRISIDFLVLLLKRAALSQTAAGPPFCGVYSPLCKTVSVSVIVSGSSGEVSVELWDPGQGGAPLVLED